MVLWGHPLVDDFLGGRGGSTSYARGWSHVDLECGFFGLLVASGYFYGAVDCADQRVPGVCVCC